MDVPTYPDGKATTKRLQVGLWRWEPFPKRPHEVGHVHLLQPPRWSCRRRRCRCRRPRAAARRLPGGPGPPLTLRQRPDVETATVAGTSAAGGRLRLRQGQRHGPIVDTVILAAAVATVARGQRGPPSCRADAAPLVGPRVASGGRVWPAAPEGYGRPLAMDRVLGRAHQVQRRPRAVARGRAVTVVASATAAAERRAALAELAAAKRISCCPSLPPPPSTSTGHAASAAVFARPHHLKHRLRVGRRPVPPQQRFHVRRLHVRIVPIIGGAAGAHPLVHRRAVHGRLLGGGKSNPDSRRRGRRAPPSRGRWPLGWAARHPPGRRRGRHRQTRQPRIVVGGGGTPPLDSVPHLPLLLHPLHGAGSGGCRRTAIGGHGSATAAAGDILLIRRRGTAAAAGRWGRPCSGGDGAPSHGCAPR